MQCVVSSCNENDTNSSPSSSQLTTYFEFPAEPSLRAAWFKALHMEDWQPEENSAVCSKHFRPEHVLEQSNGLCELQEGAVPIVNAQVCRICLAIDCKLYPLTPYKTLYKAYETVTGLLVHRDDKIPPYLCNHCSHQLLKCVRFRTKSLEGHSILMEIYRKDNCISLQSIQGIPNAFTSDMIQNESYLYDIDMELAEIENTSIFHQHIINNINEHTSVTQPTLSENITVDCVKVENDEYTQNTLNVENLTKNGMVFVPEQNIHEYSEHIEYKTENDGVNNDEVNEELNNNAMFGSTLEDDPTDNSHQLGDGRQNSEKISMRVEMMKVPQGVYTENDNQREAEGEGQAMNIGLQLEGEENKAEHSAIRVQEVTTIPENHRRTVCGKPKAKGDTRDKSLPIEETRQNAKQTITEPQVEMKVPDNLNHTQLEKHKKMEAEGIITNDKFICDICHFETYNSIQLMSHLKAHAAPKSFNCSICKYRTLDKRSLKWHLRVHSGEKPYACDICKKTFIKNSRLQIHLKEHLNEKPYCCDLCNKGFNRKDCLKVHLKNHYGDKPYVCNICNKTFNEKGSLLKHFRKHSGEKPYLCHICVKSFSGTDKLNAHLKMHSMGKPYTCDVCKKTFTRKDSIKTHMCTHSDGRPHTCDICGRIFVRKSSLEKHLIQHYDEKPYVCQVCNETFVGNNKFEAHLKIHPSQKPYLCHICKKAFSSKDYLQSHLQIHNSDKSYVCTICNKAFTRNTYLKKHMRKHSGEKPFSCDICKKSFITKDYIQIHLRMHTGEKPFTCDICNRSFSRKAHLQKHTQTHFKTQK